jgi:hypothetical protein
MPDKGEFGELQRELIALEYLKDFNWTGAVRRAMPGVTNEAARDISKLYREDGETRAIARQLAKKHARKVELTVQNVLDELKEELFQPARTLGERRLKNRNLKLAMQYLGLFIERHEVTGKDGGPIEVANATELEIARRVAFILERGARVIEHKEH